MPGMMTYAVTKNDQLGLTRNRGTAGLDPACPVNQYGSPMTGGPSSYATCLQ